MLWVDIGLNQVWFMCGPCLDMVCCCFLLYNVDRLMPGLVYIGGKFD